MQKSCPYTTHQCSLMLIRARINVSIQLTHQEGNTNPTGNHQALKDRNYWCTSSEERRIVVGAHCVVQSGKQSLMKLKRGPMLLTTDLLKKRRGAPSMLSAGWPNSFVRNAIFTCTSLGLQPTTKLHAFFWQTLPDSCLP